MAELVCGVIMALNARSGWPRCISNGTGTMSMQHSDVSKAKCATGLKRCMPNTWYKLDTVKAPATKPVRYG